MSLQNLPRVAVAAIFRNECPYVLEWLAHHRVLGVERFHIADNVSDDGTSELLQALDDLGLIERIPFPSPPGLAPQLPAYAEILAHHTAGDDWVAVIDADEFIVPTGTARTVREWLAPLAAAADVGAVVLNWAVHGSSWRLNHTAGPVTERFTRRARPEFGANHHYKSLIRMSAYGGVAGNPHHFNLKPGYRTLHADGTPLVDHLRHGKGLSDTVVWAGMRLNHYIVKSREEFDTRKRPNGSAATLGRVKGDDYFEAHDRNEAREALPAWLTQAVRDELRHLKELLAAAGHSVPVDPQVPPKFRAPFKGVQGHVDDVRWLGDALHIRGWAMNEGGLVPAFLSIRIGSQRWMMDRYERYARPDIQSHFPMAEACCGFHCVIDTAGLPDGSAVREALDTLSIAGLDSPDAPAGQPFPIPAHVLPTRQTAPA